MKTLTLKIWLTNEGKFVDEPVNETRRNENVSTYNYVRETNPNCAGLPNKKIRHKAWKAGQTQAYSDWCKVNSHKVTSRVAGTAYIQYDGRLKEWMIRRAIIYALNCGKNCIEVEPLSNARRPATSQVIYVKDFIFDANAD